MPRREATGRLDGDRVAVVLRPDAHAPAAARALLADHGRSLSRELLADAELLISELVANAVRHGEPEVTVTLRLTSLGAEVGVHDHGELLPTLPTLVPDPTRPSGRGMLILAALADRWGVETSGPTAGKTVWFTLAEERGRTRGDTSRPSHPRHAGSGEAPRLRRHVVTTAGR